MLQINSGKLYRQGVGRTNHLRGVLYTNVVLGGWGEAPIVTAAGTLLTTDSSDHPAPLVYELTERMEDHGITQGVLVSHGVLPYLQDFAVVAAFFLQATCTPDVTLGGRLLGAARSVTVATAPDKLVKGVFDKRVLVLPEDGEAFADFVDELIGLERKTFLAAMRAIRTYVTGLHRVADHLELAYAMLVASVESLAQDFDGHLGRWGDYAESKRGKVDAALEGADHAVATRVRAAIMEIEHVALARRFRDFALEHVPRSSLRQGGRPRAPGRLDLRDGLAEAYRLRSRYMHNLLGLPRLLDSDFGFSETVRSGHSTCLTIEGIRRVARTVILEFVRRQPKVDAEEYDYGLERHGVVQAQLSPEYWLGCPELLDGSSGRQWLASFLQQFAGWLLASRPGTDLGQVMLKIEVLLPGLKPRPVCRKPGDTWEFGDLALPVATIDASFEVNYLSVGAMADPLDDFYGAVGRGTLKLAASGKVTNGSDGRPLAMQVSALGLYLRDTYDFVGDQFLGLWSEMGVDRSRADEFLAWKTSIFTPIAIDKGQYDAALARDSAAAGQPVVSPLGGVMMPPSRTAAQDAEAEKRQWHSVSNADFGRYRMKAGKGHDYVNVSDVRVTRLPLPITVTF